MKIEYIDSFLLKNAFITAASVLEKNKELVNSLNVFPVPDGDTGTNMSLTMRSAVKQINKSDINDIAEIADAAATGSLMGARGNSGVILSQLFRGFSKGLQGKEQVDVKVIADAFKIASDTAYKAVMKPIEGTILTVARECAEKATELTQDETDICMFLEKVISHGEKTLKKTPEMLDVLKKAGVVDAGGKGLIFILKGALLGLLNDEEIILEDFEEVQQSNTANIEDDIKYTYCTEFIINNTKTKSESFKKNINQYGDSLLVVDGKNMIKVHIHTNNPGYIIEKGLECGELLDIKIDNMKYEHKNRISDNVKKSEEIEDKEYSFISVAMGNGIKNVFKDLNVDHIISGGQTMNPSTEDLLKAIDKVKGKNIIILPNNSNIILSATQAKELSEKNVEIVPTKTIPQGISALLAFEDDVSLEDNIKNMKEMIDEVKTGQVTFAVRDTEIEDKKINKGDIIGLYDGEIRGIGNDIEEVAIDLLTNMADDENDLITIFYGEDIDEEQANRLVDRLKKEMDDFEIEVVYGGQPLYYYLFSVE